MKHISVLVPEGELVVSSIVGPVKVFGWVDQVLAGQGRPPAFTVELVGQAPSEQYGGLFSIRPHHAPRDASRTDLILIPAFLGEVEQHVRRNGELVAWIKEQREKGAEVGSFCTGAFLLAATGLVSGKRCTTHWMFAERFRHAYPDVDLQVERIVSDEDGIYTSGGAYSFLNLVLHLVEKFCGRALALQAAKVFEIQIDRSSQTAFMIFQGLKTHGDEAILSVQRAMESRYDAPLRMDQLAADHAMSPRTFARRFKEATGCTPLEYLQRLRMEVAKKRMEEGDTVNEAMFASGYGDEKAFRSVFRRITGMAPTRYRARYGRTTDLELVF